MKLVQIKRTNATFCGTKILTLYQNTQKTCDVNQLRNLKAIDVPSGSALQFLVIYMQTFFCPYFQSYLLMTWRTKCNLEAVVIAITNLSTVSNSFISTLLSVLITTELMCWLFCRCNSRKIARNRQVYWCYVEMSCLMREIVGSISLNWFAEKWKKYKDNEIVF